MSKVLDWLTLSGDYAPGAQASAVIDTVDTAGVLSPWADGDALAHVTLSDLYPFAPETLPVNRAVAMSVPAVAKIRNVACGTVATLPLVAYRSRERMEPQPLICAQPEIGRPANITWLWVLDSLMFHGMAFLRVAQRYSDTGKPMRLEWVRNDRVADTADGPTVDGKPTPRADLIRIDAHHEGFLNYGSKVIRESLDLERSAQTAARNPLPSIELHQTGGDSLNNAQIDSLVSRWAASRRGENGGVAYTNPSIETKVHGQPAERLLVESRNHSAVAVARALGAPAWVADASVQGSSLTYSNTPSRSRELLDYFLAPYLRSIETRLSMDDVLPRGQWCSFDTSLLLRGDFQSRMTAYKTAVDAKLYTPEECRMMEAGIPAEQEDKA